MKIRIFSSALILAATVSAPAFAEDVRRRARRLSYLRGDKAVTITVSAGVAAWRRDSGGAEREQRPGGDQTQHRHLHRSRPYRRLHRRRSEW